MDIPVDNIIQDKDNSPLQRYLDSLNENTKSQFVTGYYEEELPESLESEYKKLNDMRANEIRENMHWAWSKCMGADELRPISGNGHDFWGGLGMMVIESLDTLWLMGLKEDFKVGRDWVEKELTFNLDHFTSVFETTIRVVGGLLSAYALSNDSIFKEKAVDIADRLFRSYAPFLNKPNVNLATGEVREKETSVFLSEIATNYVEFAYLSKITGDSKYVEKARSILDFLDEVEKHNGLLPLNFDILSKRPLKKEFSIANRADSFYEYLLKGWLFDGKQNEKLRRMYCEAMDGVHSSLLRQSRREQILYVGNLVGGVPTTTMHHLACFLPGLLTLGVSEKACESSDRDLNTAYRLMHTCFIMYNSTVKGVSAEAYHFKTYEKEYEEELKAFGSMDAIPDWNDLRPITLIKYILRPETVESLYVMYSKTRNPIFREWGWKIWKSIERNSKVNYGFADVCNINKDEKKNDDRGETFFYSETMNDHDNLLSNYVFNTEAHPVPILN